MELKRFTHPAVIILAIALLYSMTVGVEKRPENISLLSQSDPIIVVDEAISINQPKNDISNKEDTLKAAELVELPLPVNPNSAEPIELANSQLEEDLSDVGGPVEETLLEDDLRAELQLYQHVVKTGETISSIAKLYGVDQETIIANNGITNPNRIRVGDKLDVLTLPGVLHEVQRGENLWTLSNFYGVSTSAIIEANNVENPNKIKIGQVLFVPGGQAVAALLNLDAILSPTGQLLPNFSWPVTGRISSNYGMRWGRMHHGMDIAVPTGTEVKAAAPGRVTFSGWNSGGYGYLVTIDHGNGVETRYAHNSKVIASVGQQVKRGQVIALSGNTGVSTGPHVHFEIRYKGKTYNPREYLR